jgi:hypothetical protein
MTVKLTEAIKKTIKTEFIEGYLDDEGVRTYPSIDHLAKRHNISRTTLYRHTNPKQDDWQRQKNNFQTQMEKEIEEGRRKELVEAAKTLDKNSLNIAQALLTKVGRRIARSMEQERADPNNVGLSAAELRELSTVAANAQKIGKLALGEAQEISKVSADVSAPESYFALLEELDELANRKASAGKHTLQ